MVSPSGRDPASTAIGVSRGAGHPSASNPLLRIERKLTWLTVGVFSVALALLFNVAAVYGAIIEFHAGEGLLIGSASAGGVVMGFVFGWLARRAVA
ncbi:MAG: hypothetical protein K2Y37_01790 [Pirellulales bacterium]|nr:hypothetical protein [Pirellulales bacterium]